MGLRFGVLCVNSGGTRTAATAWESRIASVDIEHGTVDVVYFIHILTYINMTSITYSFLFTQDMFFPYSAETAWNKYLK